MSQRGLEALLRPKSIAVIGASPRPERAGYLMMRNLLAGNFSGSILPVTPKYQAVCGVMAFPTVASLPVIPDLAVICTNDRHNIELLDALGQRGCKACIVLSAPAQQQEALKICASRWQIRLLGPNSLGLLAPWQGLNASFAPVPCLPGRVAFISQSAAVANTVLDWAQQRQLGFSWFIALGDSLDIDADDLLDFLARDSKTSAILLHLEHLSDARRFVSAARSASRNKPVLVIKSGRTPHARQLLASPGGQDAAWDAAFQRAGILRVRDTHELFSAVETLSHMRPLRGERLMIIGNGAAPSAMALDELYARNGKLAELDESLISELNATLPEHIAAANPLDLKDDATAERYLQTLRLLLDSQKIDALLILYAPSAVVPASKLAQAIVTLIAQHPRGKQITLLTNWCGEHSSAEARQLFSNARVPTYRTPEGAVTAFMHMVEYKRSQKQLRETPALTDRAHANVPEARRLIQQSLASGETLLDSCQAQPLLQAYGMRIQPAWIAADAAEAVHIASTAGYPVALKLRSRDILHRSEVQGVMLYLYTDSEVQQAAEAILGRAKLLAPQARIDGLIVQRMGNRAGAQELRIVVEQDPLFGPVIMLGEGGIFWQDERQSEVSLPPLNMTLARYQVIRAIRHGKIHGHSALHPLDIAALARLLVQISDLIIECPQITRLDIRSLLASGSEFTILDATLALDNVKGSGEDRLTVRPYPKQLEEVVTLKNGQGCLFRPILPEDEPLLQQFIARVSQEDLYYRYFSEINEFTHDDLANMTQIDYDREMAFVALSSDDDASDILGVTRVVCDADNIDAEFSVLVRSDLKGIGLGRRLLEKMIHYTREHGLRQLNGITLPRNQNMLALARKLGFLVDMHLEDDIVELTLKLNARTDGREE